MKATPEQHAALRTLADLFLALKVADNNHFPEDSEQVNVAMKSLEEFIENTGLTVTGIDWPETFMINYDALAKTQKE